jgi:hypothetical protein
MMRTTLAGVLLLAGILIIVLSFLPVQFEETSISLTGTPIGQSANPLAGRSIQLNLPADLPTDQAVMLEMTLLPAALAPTSGGPSLVEGRLDLPGANVFPAPAVTAPYIPGQSVDFRWLVTAGRESPLPGRIWLTAISTDTAGAETRVPVLAHPLDLEIHRLLGLLLPDARWLGAGMGAIGLAFLAFQWRTHSIPIQKTRPRKT